MIEPLLMFFQVVGMHPSGNLRPVPGVFIVTSIDAARYFFAALLHFIEEHSSVQVTVSCGFVPRLLFRLTDACGNPIESINTPLPTIDDTVWDPLLLAQLVVIGPLPSEY